MKKAALEKLYDEELEAQHKVLVLQKELRVVQSNLVGIREELRTLKEKYRREELAKVHPVYGRREELIDTLRVTLPLFLEKVELEDSNNKKNREGRHDYNFKNGQTWKGN